MAMSHPAYRQGTSGATSGVSTPLAFPSNVAANSDEGSWLYYIAIGTTTTDVINSISDTQGNTWASVSSVNIGASRHEVWRAKSVTAGGNTVTPTYSAHTTSKRHYIIEMIGAGTTPASQSGTTDVTVAVDPIPGHALTLSGGIGFVFVTLFTDTGNATFRPSPANSIDFGGSTNMRMAIFFVDSNATSTFAPTFDLTSGTETGETMSVAQYMDPQPSSGGGGESFSAAFG